MLVPVVDTSFLRLPTVILFFLAFAPLAFFFICPPLVLCVCCSCPPFCCPSLVFVLISLSSCCPLFVLCFFLVLSSSSPFVVLFLFSGCPRVVSLLPFCWCADGSMAACRHDAVAACVCVARKTRPQAQESASAVPQHGHEATCQHVTMTTCEHALQRTETPA